ncbi:MAG: NADH-quinone oxidoreductase subunit NuoE [Candidatus Lokiarchaeota archaeon]|nr:NADH-quinone oxidoreductase subunit NuoE [Candidatus Lokiarchaeota archaeon]
MTEIVGKISDVEIQDLDEILEKHKEGKGNNVTLLQLIQNHYGYLPDYALKYVSSKLKIPLAELYGVATFYAQFSFTEKGKYVVTCCDGTACHVKGAPLLIEYLEDQLKIKSGETTDDKLFTLETVACLGCCAISPVIVINDVYYGNLTLNKVKKILKKVRKKASESTEAKE